MPNSRLSRSPRAAARAARSEIEASNPQDTYLKTALAMIFSEIERNLLQLGERADEASTGSQADVRLKVYVAIVELIALQLDTGRFQEADGTWSVLGEGLHRLQSFACSVLRASHATSPEIQDALATAGRHSQRTAPFPSA